MSPGAPQAVTAAPCEGGEWSLTPCSDSPDWAHAGSHVLSPAARTEALVVSHFSPRVPLALSRIPGELLLSTQVGKTSFPVVEDG